MLTGKVYNGIVWPKMKFAMKNNDPGVKKNAKV